MRQRSRPHAPRSGETGAAVVEFALILPLLLLLVLGGIDYGFYLNDTMVLRDAARNAARAGVVGNFASVADCTGASLEQIACSAAEGAVGATGNPRAHASVPLTWQRGEPLVVCAELEDRARIGFVPMPQDGVVRVRVAFAVETDSVAVTETSASYGGAGSWAWC
jgi:TadE-like protein